MILSQLHLPLTNKRTMTFLANPDWQHRTLLLAFPSGSVEEIGTVRFRVEPLPRDTDQDTVTVLVQSEAQPDWVSERLAERLNILESKQSSITWEGLRSGQMLRFRLRANPTVKRNGKRWPIVKDEELSAWLTRKLETGGSSLLDVTIIPEGKLVGKRRGESPAKTFHSIRFEGSLQVNDVSQFKELLACGIGSAKGFGFGLLSVAPI